MSGSLPHSDKRIDWNRGVPLWSRGCDDSKEGEIGLRNRREQVGVTPGQTVLESRGKEKVLVRLGKTITKNIQLTHARGEPPLASVPVRVVRVVLPPDPPGRVETSDSGRVRSRPPVTTPVLH